jgi:hypothetical protein
MRFDSRLRLMFIWHRFEVVSTVVRFKPLIDVVTVSSVYEIFALVIALKSDASKQLGSLINLFKNHF